MLTLNMLPVSVGDGDPPGTVTPRAHSRLKASGPREEMLLYLKYLKCLQKCPWGLLDVYSMVRIAPLLNMYESDSVAVDYQFTLSNFTCITPEGGQDLVSLRPPLTPGYHLLEKIMD